MLVASDVDGCHLLVGDLDAGFVFLPVELGGNDQPGAGGCGGDVVEDEFEGLERAAGPVAADFAEQAMFDGIPFRAPCGIVGHGDGEAVEVAEMVLQGVLPGAVAVAVAATAIGEDDELGGVGIARAAFGAPPGSEVVDGEEGGVAGDADADEAAVGERVVDAVRDGEAAGLGAEVVVVDRDRLLFPAEAGIAESADQLFFLGVDTEDRGVAVCAVLAQAVDELELGVAFGWGAGGDALAVHAQGEAHGAQQSGDGARGDRQVEFCAQVVGEVAGGATGPAQTGAGVAGGVVAEQFRELSGQCGLFFSKALRPPPGLRTRSVSKSPDSNCWRPLATVAGAIPSCAATRRSPPRP